MQLSRNLNTADVQEREMQLRAAMSGVMGCGNLLGQGGHGCHVAGDYELIELLRQVQTRLLVRLPDSNS